jgi:hypothetical protein
MMNHSNLYVQGGSAEADNGPCPDNPSLICAVTAKRGGFGNVNDERRNMQFGIRLIF